MYMRVRSQCENKSQLNQEHRTRQNPWFSTKTITIINGNFLRRLTDLRPQKWAKDCSEGKKPTVQGEHASELHQLLN